MRTIIVFAAALLSVTVAASASAGSAMPEKAPHKARALISATHFDPGQLLPRPPKDGSPEAKAELAELHHIERRRTAAQFAAAKHDDVTENPMAFAGVMGPQFNLKDLPATAKLLGEVRAEEKAVAGRAKHYFKRNRPWIIDPKLVTCSREDGPQTSYPSGHTTLGYSLAVVLARLAPNKASQIMLRAKQFAENRLVCSMHYRTDIVAGQVLGTLIGYELLRNRTFHRDFVAARGELVKAGIAR